MTMCYKLIRRIVRESGVNEDIAINFLRKICSIAFRGIPVWLGFLDLDIRIMLRSLLRVLLLIIEIEDELFLRFEDRGLAGFLALCVENQATCVAMPSTLLLVLQMSMNSYLGSSMNT